MKLALWSPRLDRGWPAALAPILARHTRLCLVEREPATGPDVDAHIYHLADDPAHGFAYRALLQSPGLVVLEEPSLHRLVRAETAGRGQEELYRREARRAHGETGTFVAGQVLRGHGGVLPTLLSLNARVLESSLGVVATTAAVRTALACRLPDRPLVHLPLDFVGLASLPERALAREALGLRERRRVVAAVQPARDEASPNDTRVLDRLAEAVPAAVVVRTSETDPVLLSRLAASDVVVALGDPCRAGLGEAVPLAVAGGRPTLVTAGAGAAREIPEGVVAPVSPGASETDETIAIVSRLLADDSLRSRMGRAAREFAARRADPAPCAQVFLDVLRAAQSTKGAVLDRLDERRRMEGTLLGSGLDEVRWGAYELGLDQVPGDVARLVAGLLGGDTH